MLPFNLLGNLSIYRKDGRVNREMEKFKVVARLLNVSNGQLTREELRNYVRASPAAVNMAISRLEESRHIRIGSAGEVVITPIGQNRAREEIMPSLPSRTNSKTKH